MKNNIYGKVKKWDLSKWIVTKFYHYTSCARETICEYDEVWHSKPVGDPYVKELYEHFLKIADAYFTLHYEKDLTHYAGSLGHQNKTTIEVQNIETGIVLYLTQYDGRYYIGRTVYSEFNNYDAFGIKRSSDFTARDRGHVKEIKTHLHKIEEDYALDLSKETDWLDKLEEKSYK